MAITASFRQDKLGEAVLITSSMFVLKYDIHSCIRGVICRNVADTNTGITFKLSENVVHIVIDEIVSHDSARVLKCSPNRFNYV